MLFSEGETLMDSPLCETVRSPAERPFPALPARNALLSADCQLFHSVTAASTWSSYLLWRPSPLVPSPMITASTSSLAWTARRIALTR